ncbi:MAG: hypothetical protein HGA90_04040 [Alphaproteobacteria bacterium]|nr:hypothetical protein [Alphaproteobacteria bacterium]
MTMLLTILRLCAFFLSAAGYVAVSRAYWKITPRASYIFVFSAQALILYFAGLAGVLSYAAYALFGAGIVLLVALIVNKKIKLAYNVSSLSAINLAFVVVFGAIAASLIDTFFVHYDNFSHWAVVVKYMMVTDRIPDAASAIIDFKSYPLGSSSFLYYFGRIVGNGEGIMLVGQATLLFACFYAIFGVIRDIKRFMLVTLLGLLCSTMAYFNISIRINNLLVDFLLPALALAVIGVLLVERNKFFTACLAVLPVLGLLSIVKNTGVIFALLGAVFLLYRSVQVQNADAKLRPFFWGALLTIGLSLVPLILWNVHTSLAFPSEGGKFSYDFQTRPSFTIDKTPAQILEIRPVNPGVVGGGEKVVEDHAILGRLQNFRTGIRAGQGDIVAVTGGSTESPDRRVLRQRHRRQAPVVVDNPIERHRQTVRPGQVRIPGRAVVGKVVPGEVQIAVVDDAIPKRIGPSDVQCRLSRRTDNPRDHERKNSSTRRDNQMPHFLLHSPRCSGKT